MMNERERAAREKGSLKLFLNAEEVTLLLASLALLQGDLSVADEQVGSLNMEEVTSLIPDGLFRSLNGVIDSTRESLLAQSRADLDERGSPQDHEYFDQILHESWERHGKLLELMQLVLIAAYSKRE